MRLFRQSRDRTEKERIFHATRNAASADLKTVTDSVLHDMSALDSKSADLLQFISVMLAALTFSLGLAQDADHYGRYVRIAIFGFIGAFAFAAWIDLRCLNMVGPDTNTEGKTAIEYENDLLKEISRRRDMYVLSLRITKIAFTLLLPFVLVWAGLIDRALK